MLFCDFVFVSSTDAFSISSPVQFVAASRSFPVNESNANSLLVCRGMVASYDVMMLPCLDTIIKVGHTSVWKKYFLSKFYKLI